MKIGVIGAGAVGAACVFALALRATAREIVLVDRTRARAKAVAADMRYGAALGRPVALSDGDYGELAGAALVMIANGANEKTGGATDRGDPAGRLWSGATASRQCRCRPCRRKRRRRRSRAADTLRRAAARIARGGRAGESTGSAPHPPRRRSPPA